MKSRFLTLAITLAAGAAIGIAVPPDPTASAEAQRGRGASRMSMTYVAKAAASDMYEIRSSELAMERARRPELREFARMLVADHRRTSELVMAAARADGLPPPPAMLEPAQRTMIRQLERARGGMAFDRAYANQQVIAHQQALALHRNYARRGDGPELRRVAASAVPIIEGHLMQARRLARGR